MKVLIVDDHAVVRQGIRQIMAKEFREATFGEAANAQEALDHAVKQPWSLVILDIALLGRSGLEVLRELGQVRPGLPVLVLSMHSRPEYAVRALKAGAAGYITKDAAPLELVQAARKLLRGERYVSPALAENIVFALRDAGESDAQECLSDREYQVMLMIASGKTTTDIARELIVSVKTVSTYRARILQKLSLKTTADIVRYALEHHLIQ